MGLDDNDREDLTAGQSEGVFLSREVLAGVPWTVGSKLAMTLIALAISILTVRLLGPKEYGILSLAKTIADTALVVCGLGLGTALVRFIPELCVQQNRAGIIRVLVKSTLLQGGMFILVGGALIAGRSYLGKWLGIELDTLLLFALGLVVARLVRGSFENGLTALYKVRANAILSVLQGLACLALVAILLFRRPTAAAALSAEAIPVLAIGLISGYLLVRTIRSLPWRSPRYGVGKRRVLGTALGSLVNSFAMIFLRQYSELFFLGYYFTAEIVGFYNLGCGLPLLLISLVPQAIQGLFTAGFAEAHSRDPQSLPAIIRVFYKILAIVIMPVAAFGFFFAARAVVLVYGAEMAPAGPVMSLFCVVHTLPLISLPISMAIVAREKLMHVQPLMFLQVFMNLVLDYLLIPRFGMYGAMAAVVLTFILTIPLRLYVVSRFIGGIYFPTAFFIKFVLLGFGWAAIMSPLAPYCSIPGLVLAGFTYVAGYLFAARALRLVKPDDVADLRRIGFPKLTMVLDLLTG